LLSQSSVSQSLLPQARRRAARLEEPLPVARKALPPQASARER